jgi:hypothetical protein
VRLAAAVFAKGSEAEEIWPVVTVKLAALPMTVPLVLRNEMVPVQDAAVPLELAVATLTTLICAVSELARPMGGSAISCVLVLLLVCANAPAAHPANAIIFNADFRKDTRHLFFLI